MKTNTAVKTIHTPTPWYNDTTSRPNTNILRDSKGQYVAEVMAEDAEFIRCACNSNAALLEALENIRDIAHSNIMKENSHEFSLIKSWANNALSQAERE